MNIEQAKEILNSAERSELRDHYFGDREIVWSVDGEPMAWGYAGGRAYEISLQHEGTEYEWEGDEAQELMRCGKCIAISRNDSTGPDTYMGA